MSLLHYRIKIDSKTQCAVDFVGVLPLQTSRSSGPWLRFELLAALPTTDNASNGGLGYLLLLTDLGVGPASLEKGDDSVALFQLQFGSSSHLARRKPPGRGTSTPMEWYGRLVTAV